MLPIFAILLLQVLAITNAVGEFDDLTRAYTPTQQGANYIDPIVYESVNVPVDQVPVKVNNDRWPILPNHGSQWALPPNGNDLPFHKRPVNLPETGNTYTVVNLSPNHARVVAMMAKTGKVVRLIVVGNQVVAVLPVIVPYQSEHGLGKNALRRTFFGLGGEAGAGLQAGIGGIAGIGGGLGAGIGAGVGGGIGAGIGAGIGGGIGAGIGGGLGGLYRPFVIGYV